MRATPDEDAVQSNSVIQESFDSVIAPLLATTILAEDSERMEDERGSRYAGSTHSGHSSAHNSRMMSSSSNPINPFPSIGGSATGMASPSTMSASGSVVGGSTFIERGSGRTPPPGHGGSNNHAHFQGVGRRDRVNQPVGSNAGKLNRVNLSAHSGQNLVRTKSVRSGSDVSDV
jgi:hypothetical protein